MRGVPFYRSILANNGEEMTKLENNFSAVNELMDPSNEWKHKKKINQTIFTSEKSSDYYEIILRKTLINFKMKTNKNLEPEFE